MENIEYYKEKLASIQDMFSMTTKHLNQVQRELKEAHDALSESVRYAEKIQAQIVPSFDEGDSVFNDYYFYLNQRDGVGGDFIYLSQQGEYTIFGLMDCTGHGVPGALLAVMGHNFLNEIIFGKKLTKPSSILAKLDQRIQDYFKTKDPNETLRDGMDGVICSYKRGSGKIQYSLAGRPLLIKKNNEIERIRSARTSIGGLKSSEFINDVIEVSSGDELYMFSDGLSDQFGGAKDKKFTSRRIANHLNNDTEISLRKKGQKLVNELLEWRGEKGQTDDISYLSVQF